MGCSDFLSSMKSYGALFAPAASAQSITLTNTSLQHIRAAMLPQFMIDFYSHCGGINLGNGYIFGPNEISRGQKYPIPNILQINTDLSGLPYLRGKTVFGRNDLFWFAFVAFGSCFMLDNLNLNILRKYDDPYRAMTDCLIAGKL